MSKLFDRPSRAIEHYEELVESGRLTMAAAASEFGALLATGVKNMMEAGTKEAPAMWPQVCKLEKSTKPWERYAGTSVPTGIEKVQPGQEAPDMDFSSDSTVLRNETYAGKLVIPSEFMEDDQSGEIKRRVNGAGQAMTEFEDTTIANILNNGAATTCYDGSNLFATNHPNMTGGAANTNNSNYPATGTATEANTETILKGMQKWVGWNGKAIQVAPRIFLTGTDNWTNILRLINSRATQTVQVNEGVPNVFQGIGKPVLWKRISASRWYVVTDIMGLIYQLRKALQVAREGPISGVGLLRRSWIFAIEKRFAAKAINWRFATRCVT